MSHILEVIRNLMEMKNNLQVYHWNTKSYAKHKATDELITSLSNHIDKFVEVYLGVNPNSKIQISNINIRDYDDKQLTSALIQVNNMMSTVKEQDYSVKKGSASKGSLLRGTSYKVTSDLVNIKEEIVADIHRTLYLLTLS